MILSQVSNMSVAIGTAAPNLAIATVHAPKLATILVFLIVAASFTTTAPIAAIAAEYFAESGSKRYKIIGTILVLLALIISFAGSYAQIINILVSVSGRVGVAVYIFAVLYRIYKMFISPKGERVVK